jgi:hypothetical protein
MRKLTAEERAAKAMQNLPPGLLLWKKGERSAEHFHEHDYWGAFLLADGTMVTGPDDGWQHHHVYNPIIDELRAASAIRMSSPVVYEIYFPVTESQTQEIARFYHEELKIQEGRDWPVQLFWEFDRAPAKGGFYYSRELWSGEGSIGDFLRDVEKYNRRMARKQKTRKKACK